MKIATILVLLVILAVPAHASGIAGTQSGSSYGQIVLGQSNGPHPNNHITIDADIVRQFSEQNKASFTQEQVQQIVQEWNGMDIGTVHTTNCQNDCVSEGMGHCFDSLSAKVGAAAATGLIGGSGAAAATIAAGPEAAPLGGAGGAALGALGSYTICKAAVTVGCWWGCG